MKKSEDSDQVINNPTSKREANMERRRERILSSAAEIIVEDGIDSVTLKKIAERAELTIPTIHNLIGKKDEIFAQLLAGMTHPFERMFEDVEFTDLLDTFQLLIDRLIEEFEKNWLPPKLLWKSQNVYVTLIDPNQAHSTMCVSHSERITARIFKKRAI